MRCRDAVELRDGVMWSNGFGISLGPVINERTGADNWPDKPVRAEILNLIIEKVEPWHVVNENFSYDVGLKIGIVAYNCGVASEEAFSKLGMGVDAVILKDEDEGSYATATRGKKETKIAPVFGDDGVMIYTGCVTRAGDQHVEYNINTFKGCSGAIVTVMDRTHYDFGIALAVHAGYKPELKANLGFKLAGAFDRPFSAEE